VGRHFGTRQPAAKRSSVVGHHLKINDADNAVGMIHPPRDETFTHQFHFMLAVQAVDVAKAPRAAGNFAR
jgi:hypothetical protein